MENEKSIFTLVDNNIPNDLKFRMAFLYAINSVPMDEQNTIYKFCEPKDLQQFCIDFLCEFLKVNAEKIPIYLSIFSKTNAASMPSLVPGNMLQGRLIIGDTIDYYKKHKCEIDYFLNKAYNNNGKR